MAGSKQVMPEILMTRQPDNYRKNKGFIKNIKRKIYSTSAGRKYTVQ
jgi:hypothetical protein